MLMSMHEAGEVEVAPGSCQLMKDIHLRNLKAHKSLLELDEYKDLMKVPVLCMEVKTVVTEASDEAFNTNGQL